MKLILFISMLLTSMAGQAASLQSEFATGRAYYSAGEFKKAAAHFQLALNADPRNAEFHYWTGMSYQMLADISAPFDRKYNSKARAYLTQAMELAPDRSDYRRELFDFLLGSAGCSEARWRQAAGILRTVSESDPDYDHMRRRFEQERSVNASAGARLSRILLAIPRAAYGVTELPVSALSSRRDAELSTALR
jgi:tetratricopeptide (TPR) repeat protein